MEKLTVFYLDGCPYCRNARKAFGELAEEKPEYGKVSVEWVEEKQRPDVEWVEEKQRPDLVEGHDYYYVPTIYAGSRKLYEAHPGESYEECKGHVRSALDVVTGN